ATFEDGDCDRPANKIPDWLDISKFYRGQQFALRYFCTLSISNLMSLLMIFSFADGLKPLILSQKSNTPYRAFKRYLSTIRRFRNWYTMSYTKCPMFQTIAKDFADTCPLAKSRQCPYTMSKMKGLNQGDMSGTQFACMGLIVLYPEQFGIYNVSDEDLEAFCHLWRGLGYLLGIQDQYNFCRGSLQEIRQRTEDFIEHWVKPNLSTVTAEWEHMSISLYEGNGVISYFDNYKVFLLY
ncbi:hypothetical protein EAG_12674, partial [Camponotus floridanus]